MVRKLIIRIAKDEAGESNFSNLSSEEYRFKIDMSQIH